MPELWRTISVHERYEVSNLGRVRNRETERVLKPDLGGPYLRVKFGRSLRESVHVLVCTAWHGQRPQGMHCLHRNDNKRDNRPENLYWGTRLDNAADALRNDKYKRGHSNGKAKLSEANVREIKRLRGQGLFYRTIGEMFGVSDHCILCICKGITWKHLA